MMDTLRAMAAHPFFLRALVTGLLVSLCAALLGVSLVLKRYAMIGDGLSHVGFGALTVAAAAGAAPLFVALPVVVAAAFLLLRISGNGRIKGDAAVALVSTASLAIGVATVSLTSGMNADVNSYLFGSIWAIRKEDFPFCITLCLAILLLYVFFYPKLFAVTFDESFAAASGLRTGRYSALLAVLTAVTIVLGMRVMGALLISSLVVFPALSSMRLCKSYRGVTLGSAAISSFCMVTGIGASFVYATPPGASVVIVNTFVFLLFWILETLRKSRKAQEHHQNAKE